MRLPEPYDVSQWKGIADALGVSTGHVRRLAKREHDPIPHAYLRATPIASRAELHAWLQRQVRPRVA